MSDEEILKMILDEESFDDKLKLAEVIGYDRLNSIITNMILAGKKVPHVAFDVMGTLKTNEDKKLAKMLEESSPVQLAVLVKAFGPQKCKRAAQLIADPNKAQHIINCVTPMIFKESVDFVTMIEKMGVSNYKLAQKMVMLRGLKNTERDIKITERNRPVKHIVVDVLKPLKRKNLENSL